MPSPIDALPGWALNTLLACAHGLNATELVADVERVRDAHLFEEVGDEAWFGHFPFCSRVASREMTPPEQWSSVSHEAIDAIFGSSGELAKVYARYESRPGQIAMAHAVANALNARHFLFAEAGTGVGKSLAYLVPCALWACANNLPIVISTNTRNLQSQLLSKDLPLVRRIVSAHLPPDVALEATVLKGRGNYLCLKTFGAYLEGGFERLTDAEALVFCDLVIWACATPDGDLDTFAPTYSRGDLPFVRTFGCQGDTCSGKKCRFYKRCFLLKARQNAQRAHLIIVNHALVFAELSSPGSLLPPHAQIVFDEAHNLEDAATGALSGELSPHALFDLCQRIAPSRGREAGSLPTQIREDFVDALLPNPAENVEALQQLADLRACGSELAKAGTTLFGTLCQFMSKTPESTVRYRSVPLPGSPDDFIPAFRREVCLTGAAFLPAEPFVPEAEIGGCRDAIQAQLHKVEQLLDALLNAIARKMPTQGDTSRLEELVSSIQSAKEGFKEFGGTLSRILSGEDPEWVYWMARTPGDDHAVSLTAAPLDISRQLASLLYASKETLVFSSATLRVNNDFAHIRRRLGLLNAKKPVETFVAESPFDYPRQCCVAVADFLPDIGSAENYALEFSRLMFRLFTDARGRSLALFTSYDMLHACANILEPHLRARGIDLLVQSATLGRDAMTASLREQTRPTVLFGTQSFWEGVDVIGEALSCVVIARLPFESYGDPLFKARCERIERSGGSSFAELSVPRAVIRFRQGFGRLIRSRSDRGIVVVADSRIVRRSYGAAFTKALPVTTEVFHSRGELASRLRSLLAPETH